MHEFLAVATAHFLALISPGPDFFIILSTSIRNGASKAVWTCLGIAVANGLYILLAIAGFTLIKDNIWVLNVMKIIGAAFLCYLGSVLIRSSRRELYDNKNKILLSGGTAGQLFAIGFMAAILNPKNSIFYMSLYSLFISDSSELSVHLIYGVWMFMVVFLWDTFIAFSVGSRLVKSLLNRYIFRIEQFSGVLIMLLGLTMALY